MLSRVDAKLTGRYCAIVCVCARMRVRVFVRWCGVRICVCALRTCALRLRVSMCISAVLCVVFLGKCPVSGRMSVCECLFVCDAFGCHAVSVDCLCADVRCVWDALGCRALFAVISPVERF